MKKKINKYFLYCFWACMIIIAALFSLVYLRIEKIEKVGSYINTTWVTFLSSQAAVFGLKGFSLLKKAKALLKG